MEMNFGFSPVHQLELHSSVADVKFPWGFRINTHNRVKIRIIGMNVVCPYTYTMSVKGTIQKSTLRRAIFKFDQIENLKTSIGVALDLETNLRNSINIMRLKISEENNAWHNSIKLLKFGADFSDKTQISKRHFSSQAGESKKKKRRKIK